MTDLPRTKRTRRFALPATDDHRAVETIDALIRAPAEPDPDLHLERGRGRAGASSPFGGLDSRLTFLDAVRREDDRVRRYRRPAAVAVLAIIAPSANGRAAAEIERGSRRLIDATTRIVRETDRVARVAPGRLQLLMPETRTRQAERVVDRIRSQWEERMAAGPPGVRLVTAVAAIPPGDGVVAGLERVDSAVRTRAASEETASEP